MVAGMDPSIYQSMRQVEDRHWWFVGRRNIVSDIINRHLHTPQAKILDAGCGTGGNLLMLSRYGQVDAFELDDAARASANDRQITVVRYGCLPDDLPRFDYKFDLIVMLDVLEHIDDDSSALQVLSDHLTDDGIILVTVPAFAWLWSKHDDIHHHRRRYHMNDIRMAVERAGLEVKSASYFNIFLFPLIATVRIIQRLFPPTQSASADLRIPPIQANRLLCWSFSLERYLLRYFKLPFGVSLLAIIQHKHREARV